MQFTSHNVLLPDGSQTAPGRVLVGDSGNCRAALRYLDLHFAGRRAGVTVADVGCLEGGYALAFAGAGYDVTGIEKRQENYDRAAWLARQFALPNLRFIRGDAFTALPGTRYDAIFCSGLLYHLENPVAFLRLLAAATGSLLILNTHFSLPGGHDEGIHHPDEGCDPFPSEHEGRAGHWFREGRNRWAGADGGRSFWLRKDDLLASLLAAGFASAAEQHDWRDPPVMPWGSGLDSEDRGMFLAVK